jgi:hypothetical protein
MEASGLGHAPAALAFVNNTETHEIWSWVGTRAFLDVLE